MSITGTIKMSDLSDQIMKRVKFFYKISAGTGFLKKRGKGKREKKEEKFNTERISYHSDSHYSVHLLLIILITRLQQRKTFSISG